MSAHSSKQPLLLAIGIAALTLCTLQASRAFGAPIPPLPAGGPISIREVPLFLTDNAPPLNMLVVGRDHRLYYEAYNDASDLNGDGQLDVGFNPNIDYYGYFDTAKCYTYSSTSGRFEPAGAASGGRCSGQWSGQWLNYVTMARVDALRKVLYGGRRTTDSTTDTVLSRTHVPQDAHSWGKEYESIARDGYDIRDYTPLGLPVATTRHLFANTSLLSDGANGVPRMRVLQNSAARIWNWVSKERPVAGGDVDTVGSVAPTDYIVRVRVCVAGLLESNCKQYPSGVYKPTGLIHDYGESDTMYFGLITGSYEKNTQGGVLRKQVGTFKNEVNTSTGQFLGTNPGIIRTLDRLRTTGFQGNYEYTESSDNCGWVIDGPITSGRCRMWGNPTAEMMYESLRYFAGKGAALPAFAIASTGNPDATLGLSRATWNNPYGGSAPSCAKPFQTVISDVNNSYDTDNLPGTAFGSYSSGGDDISGLNVATIGQNLWNLEYGTAANHFIGESLSQPLFGSDGAPTPKIVTSFGNIRGLAPEEPTKLGGYYAASVAHFGLRTDLNSAPGSQRVQTFAVALASPLPKIEIPVAGSTVTIVPFAKSVGNVGGCLGPISAARSDFQPTNTIVDFYVEYIAPDRRSGSFRVNFEDVEQGADHDMDAIVRYEYTVTPDDEVEVRLTSEYAAGCIIQHMGYVISGTTADGTYLEVRDVDTPEANDPDYFLDVPPTVAAAPPTEPNPPDVVVVDPLTAWDDDTALPTSSVRQFKPGAASGATLLKDPLWYAAKYGGFNDLNGDFVPQNSEWDANNDGTPDNYFLVTNALTLKDQLSAAFEEILVRVGSASSASVNASSISTETRVYQALFSTGDWSGRLISLPINPDGTLRAQEWDASTLVPAPNARKIATVNTGDTAVPFNWTNLDSTRRDQLVAGADTATAQGRLDYLRGDRSREVRQGGAAAIFRNRNPLTVLGDFVSSSPAYVSKPRARYPEAIESESYAAFKTAQTDRQPMLYSGANDGMLHAFDAETGEERWAFIPGTVFNRLHFLTRPDYQHRYYVDGAPTIADAHWASSWKTVLVGGLNRGGQGVYALNITDPAAATEAQVASKFLWEFNDSDDADMGYSYSRPVVARMRDGNWVAIFGNGYNNTESDGIVSSSGDAVLYVVDIATGNLVRKISTGVGTTQDPLGVGRPNGLASVSVVDIDGDAVADYAYAGDLFGNMWKFNFTGSSASSWDVAYRVAGNALPIFQARNDSNQPQPITSRPQVGFGPGGRGLMVYFGTGKFLELNDRITSMNTTQSFYGIIDRLSGTYATDRIPNRTDLTRQTIDEEVDFDARTRARVTSDNALGSGRGWFLDFEAPPSATFEGEMQITDSVLRNDRVLFNTVIPNPDLCGYGGKSWLYLLDAYSGGRLDRTFDANADGEINADDTITVTNAAGDEVQIPASSVQLGDGVDAQARVVTGGTDAFAIISTTGDGRPAIIDPTPDPDDDDDDESPKMKIVKAEFGETAVGRQSWRQLR
jgi:type IV pilus assembly protein PilY1